MKETKKGREKRLSSNKLSLLLAVFILLPFCALLAQSSQQVGGTVTDSKGAPAAGVTVGVKGGSTQTVTNNEGAFKIRVPQNATLTFSAVNFDPVEFKVVSGQPVNLALKERLTQLNDVVVVGYGRS